MDSKHQEFISFNYVKSGTITWGYPLTAQMVSDHAAMLNASSVDYTAGVSNSPHVNVSAAQVLDRSLEKAVAAGPEGWFKTLPSKHGQVCLGQRIVQEMSLLNVGWAQRSEIIRELSQAAWKITGVADVVYLNDKSRDFDDMLARARQMKSLL